MSYFNICKGCLRKFFHSGTLDFDLHGQIIFALLAKAKLQRQFISAQFCKEKIKKLQNNLQLSNLYLIRLECQNAPLDNDDIGQLS